MKPTDLIRLKDRSFAYAKLYGEVMVKLNNVTCSYLNWEDESSILLIDSDGNGFLFIEVNKITDIRIFNQYVELHIKQKS